MPRAMLALLGAAAAAGALASAPPRPRRFPGALGLGELISARLRGPAAAPRRGFAYNIHAEEPKHEATRKGTTREVLEAIFRQHASGDGGPGSLAPGAPFKAACVSLSKEFPQLQALQHDAMEGRAFEVLKQNEQGVMTLREWTEGMTALLEGGDAKFKNLADRLKQGVLSGSPETLADVKRVAVIGGGVAGLQTARALSRRGKEVVVFEKSDNVGGVWRENYDSFGLQVPKELYEFPEFPYPADKQWQKFPPGPEVQEYIERYCDHFGLRSMVRLSTGVSRVEVGESGKGWTVFAGRNGDAPQGEHFDFVVVATGMYGWPPHIPSVRGQEEFEGQIQHSATFVDAKACEGKDVVVVGGGKSAVDNAVSGGRHGKSSTLVFRAAHWPVPRYLANLVPFKYGTYSRAGHATLPTHYDVSPTKWYMHSLMTPVKWTWWRIVEGLFRAQFRLSGDLVPETPIELDLFGGGQILNYDFRQMLKEGRVKAIKGSIEKLHPKHVELQDGTMLPCDVLVFGTGFKKNYDIFDRLVQARLRIEDDGMFTFRNMIPPGVPNLAFVGSEVSTFNNILTHALQAEWLARVLDGHVQLPNPMQMRADIEKEQAWKRSWMPATSARSAIWQLHMIPYHDRLVEDMGEQRLRKGMNKFAEAFAPYTAADYRSLFTGEPEASPHGKAQMRA